MTPHLVITTKTYDYFFILTSPTRFMYTIDDQKDTKITVQTFLRAQRNTEFNTIRPWWTEIL
jgi:hypothetical protein